MSKARTPVVLRPLPGWYRAALLVIGVWGTVCVVVVLTAAAWRAMPDRQEMDLRAPDVRPVARAAVWVIRAGCGVLERVGVQDVCQE